VFEHYSSGSRGPVVSKRVVEDYIACSLNIHREVLKFERLDNLPRQWKHACLTGGVTILRDYALSLGESTVINFVFCGMCGKVIYFYDTR